MQSASPKDLFAGSRMEDYTCFITLWCVRLLLLCWPDMRTSNGSCKNRWVRKLSKKICMQWWRDCQGWRPSLIWFQGVNVSMLLYFLKNKGHQRLQTWCKRVNFRTTNLHITNNSPYDRTTQQAHSCLLDTFIVHSTLLKKVWTWQS